MLITPLEQEIDEMVKILQGAKLDVGGGRTDTTRAAVIAAVKGEIDASEELWLQAMRENPESSYIVHDYAAFLVNFRRSYQLAAPHFERACMLEPKKAIHFFQAASCFHSLNVLGKMRQFASQARACNDFASLGDDQQHIVLRIIGDA